MVTNQNQIQNQTAVLTNAFAVSMFGNPQRLLVEFRRLSPQEARETLNAVAVQNYIRHPGTLQALQQLFGLQLAANSGLYTWRNGERIIMVVLANAPRGQEVMPQPEDLLIYEIHVIALE